MAGEATDNEQAETHSLRALRRDFLCFNPTVMNQRASATPPSAGPTEEEYQTSPRGSRKTQAFSSAALTQALKEGAHG